MTEAVAATVDTDLRSRQDDVTFYDYTLTLDGRISSRLHHRTESLSRPWVQMFKQLLQTSGDNFRKLVPLAETHDLEISLASEGQAALAAFSLGGTIVTISALLSGWNGEDDTRTLGYFRTILAEEGRPRGLPAPHLADISERPIVLSIPLPTSRAEDMGLVGKLEVGLAAAFFELLEDRPHERDPTA